METPYVPVWKPAPFIRLLPLLCIGIVWQLYAGLSLLSISIIALSALVCLFAFRFLPSFHKFRFAPLQGVFVMALLFSAGLVAVFTKDIRNRENWFGHHWKEGNGLICTLSEEPEEKEKRFRGEARVEYVVNDSGLNEVCGRLYVYFPKNDSTAVPCYGRRFMLTGKIQPVGGPANPGDFDFRQYASFKNIHHVVYLQSGGWEMMPGTADSPLYEFLIQTRHQIIATLQRFIGPGSVEAGVAEALLIGYKQDLDKETVKAYSNTGVVHIIAISGLHLGLIYWMLQLIFKWVRINRFRIFSGFSQLVFLWMFSLLTGGSASVLRSAAMFSFIIAGDMMGRSASVFNTIACSAFFLLCYDPFLLWDAGFQLSHLAVAGLVTIQQPLYRSVYVKNKWLDKIWSLTAVTLAAQVFTFPACLYYFRQFPVYFLFSNLPVVPLSTLILFAGLLLLIISPFTEAAVILGRAISFSISGMNEFVDWIDELPGSVIAGLNQDMVSVCLMYAFIVFACLFIVRMSKPAFFAGLVSFLLFSFYSLIREIRLARQEKLIVYRVREGSVIDFIGGGGFVEWTAMKSDTDTSSLQSSRSFTGANKKTGTISMKEESVAKWREWTICIIDSLHYPKIPADTIRKVMLVLRRNTRVPVSLLNEVYRPSLVVFDGSCSLWKIDKWRNECEKLHLPAYSIPHQGALVMDGGKLIP